MHFVARHQSKYLLLDEYLPGIGTLYFIRYFVFYGDRILEVRTNARLYDGEKYESRRTKTFYKVVFRKTRARKLNANYSYVCAPPYGIEIFTDVART